MPSIVRVTPRPIVYPAARDLLSGPGGAAGSSYDHTLTVGQSGTLNGWLDGVAGDITGQPIDVNGEQLWGVYYEDANNIWWVQITSASILPQEHFNTFTVQTDGDPAELALTAASADTVNYQNGRTRWRWGSQLVGWEDASVGSDFGVTFT